MSARALAWRDGSALRLAPGPGIGDVFDLPLGLGRPARVLFATLSSAELEMAVRSFGERPRVSKADRVAQLTSLVGDRARLFELLASAPRESREELFGAIREGRRIPLLYAYYSGVLERDPAYWLTRHGLAVLDDFEVEVPREVALAVRDGHLVPVVRPNPPPVATTGVGEAESASRAGERAAAVLAAVQAVADELDRAPAAMLKAGGIGVRELRRLASAASLDVDVLRRVLALLAAASLAAYELDQVLLTEDYDSWAALPPGPAWVALAQAWLMLPCPLVDPTEPAPFSSQDIGRMLVGTGRVRHDVLSIVGELPGAEPAGIAAWMLWRAPLVHTFAVDDMTEIVNTVYGEAEWMGLVGAGALAPAGRMLIDAAADAAAAAAAATPYLSASQTTVTLQADLTALVTGPPAPALATLLDQMADRTGRDAAHTWRFTPASVRRALDAGQTREDLLAKLATAAPRGVPQVLEQLFADIARRHGKLRVGSGACWVRSDDAPLLAEVLRDRKLAALKFRALAPTVLATSRPPADTLKALRAAGYAPVREDSSGRVVVARVERRRAELGLVRRVPSGPAGWKKETRGGSAAALAARLVGQAPPPAQRRDPPRRAGSGRSSGRPVRPAKGPDAPEAGTAADVFGAFGPGGIFFGAPDGEGGGRAGEAQVIPDQRAMARHVPGLPVAQRRILAAHIGAGASVLVEYHDGAAARRELVVDPQWQPPLLVGSSPRSDAMLAIPLDQIVRVHD